MHISLHLGLLACLAVTSLTVSGYEQNVTFVSETPGSYPLQPLKRRLQESSLTGPGCFARNDILLKGAAIYQRPLQTSNPDDCCAACQARDDCAGWEFRGCCNYCSLLSEIHEVRDCDQADCVAGIIDEAYREKEEEYIDLPSERFNGLIMTCEEKSFYISVGTVLAACGVVQRQCAPAATTQEATSLPYVGPDCEMVEDINYFGFDYNQGFMELTLTPEDCCRSCMQDRGCNAWTRTYSGECWKKWRVPPKQDWRTVQGDVSGRRQHFEAECGQTFEGFFLDTYSPSEKMADAMVDTADECCARCLDVRACVVWSFYDGICRRIFTLTTNRIEEPGAISAYVVTAPLRCGDDIQSPVEQLDIVKAHNAECASILISGPGEPRPGCRGRRQANRIFEDACDRVKGLI